MAIPKLLQQMRHSVQDTGDTMTGTLTVQNTDGTSQSQLNPAVLGIANNSMSLQAGVSASLGPMIQARTATGTQRIVFGTDDSSNDIITLSGSNTNPIVTGLSDPVNAQDVATKNYVDNSGGTFYAIYGTTTYEEIVDAFNKGKTVKMLYSDTSSYVQVFELHTRPTGSNNLYFYSLISVSSSYSNFRAYCAYIASDSTWYGMYNSIGTSMSNAQIYNGTTTISSSSGYYRPIRVSTAAPTSSDGNTGDIWIQYSL